MPTNIPELHAQKRWSPSRVTQSIDDLQVLLWVIILLLTAIVMVRFPDLGAVIEQYEQF